MLAYVGTQQQFKAKMETMQVKLLLCKKVQNTILETCFCDIHKKYATGFEYFCGSKITEKYHICVSKQKA